MTSCVPNADPPSLDNRTKLLLPPSASSSIQLPQSLNTQVNNDPYFFVPPGFRPNSHFVGMKKQLVDLDERLFDIQARQTGTAAVVLHGPAGSGKSHLARQYLYRHRSRFKGGIFWINARIKDEMHRDLWQIAQKFVARDSPSTRIDPSGNGREYVSAVREWFSNRSEWLIVVDGVALDNRVQAEEIQKMIPDSKNSSLIYTSEHISSSQLKQNTQGGASRRPPQCETLPFAFSHVSIVHVVCILISFTAHLSYIIRY